MFFNSVQNFDSWKNFFGDPQGQTLGLLGALYQIGSLVSIPFVSVHVRRPVKGGEEACQTDHIA